MDTLYTLAQSNSQWSLEEFVEVLNDLLPQFLPVQKAHTKVRETMTPRLVRHYTSQNMLDEPLKHGRYAIYTYRHLLQMLVVRRLLSEGYGASAIDNLAKAKDNSELEALLQGGVRLTITAANPALGFLQQVKKRQSTSGTPKASAKKSAQKKYSLNATPQKWTRIEILPGLEIHVQEDFKYPHSPREEENLLQYIAQKLSNHEKNKN